MNYSYWRTERLIRDAVDRRILRRVTLPDQIVSVLTDTDLLVLTGICLLGLFTSLAVMLAVPGFTEIIEVLR